MPPAFIILLLIEYVGPVSSSARDSLIGATAACLFAAAVRYIEKRAEKQTKSADVELKIKAKDAGDFHQQVLDEATDLRRELKEMRELVFQMQLKYLDLKARYEALKFKFGVCE